MLLLSLILGMEVKSRVRSGIGTRVHLLTGGELGLVGHGDPALLCPGRGHGTRSQSPPD